MLAGDAEAQFVLFYGPGKNSWERKWDEILEAFKAVFNILLRPTTIHQAQNLFL